MASNTKFVEEQVQPTMRQLRETMQKLRDLEEAYRNLGGEEFIKTLAGSEPVQGFEDITGDDVVNGIATTEAFLDLWEANHNVNVTKIALRK